MSAPAFAFEPHPAVVSRGDAQSGRGASYLRLLPSGATDWTPDPKAATAFASMREAARAALRLPAAVRAYGLPLETEVAMSRPN